jgi:ribosomal protein S1
VSQEAENETTIVTEAAIEADTSRETTGADAVEAVSADIDEALDMEAAGTPASAEAEGVTQAVAEAQETTEESEAATRDTAEKPAGEEVAAAKQEPEKEKKAPEPKTPLSELEVGTELTGRVVGIADFGAFVDIGAETDGLIHISGLSDGRVKKVSDVVSVGQQVNVWIKDVDTDHERISLSMRHKPRYRLRDLKPGMIIDGRVTGIRDYGIFVDIGSETEGLVHVSEMADGYVSKPSELVSAGDDVEVRIKKVDRRRRRISLSMKGFGSAVRPREPEPEEVMPTAMELAMRRALGELEEHIEEASHEQIDVEETSREELGDVFARMLRDYQADTENE